MQTLRHSPAEPATGSYPNIMITRVAQQETRHYDIESEHSYSDEDQEVTFS